MKKLLLNVKAIINKRNNQINFSLPRKKVPTDVLKKICSNKIMKMELFD